MATLLVLYKTPTDPAAFDRHYAETHVGLAKKIPGLKSYSLSKGAVNSPTGAAGVYLIATLTFDSVATLQSGLASAEGKAAAGDVPNFASGGADMFVFEDAPA